MQSNMIHQYSNVPEAFIERSNINRSFSYKTTMYAGYLVPFYNDLMYPGDTFTMQTYVFGRMATPVYPIFDNVFVETFYFSVPIRLIWDNFQAFMGEVNTNTSSQITTMEIPHRQVLEDGVYTENTLQDYLGLPTYCHSYDHSVLPLRAYTLVWNEWFRSDYLQDPIEINFGDDGKADPNYVLLRRGKRFDYYTSCLPFPQAGPGVEISLSGNAPVFGDGHRLGLAPNSADNAVGYISMSGNVGAILRNAGGSEWGSGQAAFVTSDGKQSGLLADLSDVAAITINSLREAFTMQQFLERMAQGGNRYTEIVRAMFGVSSPDARLQRPEFLGHGQSRININPVEQTSQTSADGTPLGQLAAYGVFRDEHHAFSYSATEHCIILGLINIRADLTYQNSLWKHWSYISREQLYWPQFSHLGEQAVYVQELWNPGEKDTLGNCSTIQDEVFGYQERYGECRYYPSMVTGLFKTNTKSGLDAWHLSQSFTKAPQLNSSFIEDNPPIERVVAVPSEPHFIVDIFCDLQCARPMPVYSTPGLTRM